MLFPPQAACIQLGLSRTLARWQLRPRRFATRGAGYASASSLCKFVHEPPDCPFGAQLWHESRWQACCAQSKRLTARVPSGQGPIERCLPHHAPALVRRQTVGHTIRSRSSLCLPACCSSVSLSTTVLPASEGLCAAALMVYVEWLGRWVDFKACLIPW